MKDSKGWIDKRAPEHFIQFSIEWRNIHTQRQRHTREVRKN